jgi:hypothetical protein
MSQKQGGFLGILKNRGPILEHVKLKKNGLVGWFFVLD